MPDRIVKPVESSEELEAAFHIRREVFQMEQGVDDETEFDGLDDMAEHFLVVDASQPVATARVRYLPELNAAKIERMAVLSSHRGQSIGRELLQFILATLTQRHISVAKLNAQVRVQDFYLKLGFEPHGSIFDEAGIPHIEMRRRML